MKQPHTEKNVRHTDGQQNTGNHKKPGTPESGGADRFGGTRAGAENVERGTPGRAGGGVEQEGGEQAGGAERDIERVTESEAEGHLHEVSPERDERNRG